MCVGGKDQREVESEARGDGQERRAGGPAKRGNNEVKAPWVGKVGRLTGPDEFLFPEQGKLLFWMEREERKWGEKEGNQ